MESGKYDEKAEELIIHKHLKQRHCWDVHHLLKKEIDEQEEQKQLMIFFSFSTSNKCRFHEFDIVI